MGPIRIGVTGASGALGGRVARRLANQGVGTCLIVRDASRAPNLPHSEVAIATYTDHDAMVSALSGIETVFFVSGFESEDRLDQHRSAIDAFVAAGVKRVVYTSFLNTAPGATFTLARHHYHTEEYLKASGLPFVALRNSLYVDELQNMVVDGAIRGPAGEGRFAPVTRDDIADVAVAVLLANDQRTTTYDVTGPALMTMRNVAEDLSAAWGDTIAFVDETLWEAYASRSHIKAPAFEIEGWVTSYRAIALGEMAVVSDTVERFAGHPPTSLKAFLEGQA